MSISFPRKIIFLLLLISIIINNAIVNIGVVRVIDEHEKNMKSRASTAAKTKISKLKKETKLMAAEKKMKAKHIPIKEEFIPIKEEEEEVTEWGTCGLCGGVGESGSICFCVDDNYNIYE